VFWQKHIGKFIKYLRQCRIFADSFILFHIIMVDTIHSVVQKVSGTQLDMVYRTAAF